MLTFSNLVTIYNPWVEVRIISKQKAENEFLFWIKIQKFKKYPGNRCRPGLTWNQFWLIWEGEKLSFLQFMRLWTYDFMGILHLKMSEIHKKIKMSCSNGQNSKFGPWKWSKSISRKIWVAEISRNFHIVYSQLGCLNFLTIFSHSWQHWLLSYKEVVIVDVDLHSCPNSDQHFKICKKVVLSQCIWCTKKELLLQSLKDYVLLLFVEHFFKKKNTTIIKPFSPNAYIRICAPM